MRQGLVYLNYLSGKRATMFIFDMLMPNGTKMSFTKTSFAVAVSKSVGQLKNARSGGTWVL